AGCSIAPCGCWPRRSSCASCCRCTAAHCCRDERMSPHGRPKGSYRSAEHEGTPMTPHGRPKGSYRSAEHEGTPMTPHGRPKGSYRSAEHEGTPMSEQERNLVQLLAYAYLQSARPDKAAALLCALDAVAPGQRKVLRTLALAQVRCGQAQSALDTLE